MLRERSRELDGFDACNSMRNFGTFCALPTLTASTELNGHDRRLYRRYLRLEDQQQEPTHVRACMQLEDGGLRQAD
jgi:hypothetical protein